MRALCDAAIGETIAGVVVRAVPDANHDGGPGEAERDNHSVQLRGGPLTRLARVVRTQSDSIASAGSLGSIASAGSIGSIASAGSLKSIASAGSLASVGSAGSVGSIGSLASIGSIGSIASIGSIGSIASIGSIGSIAAIGRVGRIGERSAPSPAVATAYLIGAVAALACGALLSRPR